MESFDVEINIEGKCIARGFYQGWKKLRFETGELKTVLGDDD